MSRGPWRLRENPRCAVSACIDDIPTSNRTASNLLSVFVSRWRTSEKRPSNGTICGLNTYIHTHTCVVSRWRMSEKRLSNGTICGLNTYIHTHAFSECTTSNKHCTLFITIQRRKDQAMHFTSAETFLHIISKHCPWTYMNVTSSQYLLENLMTYRQITNNDINYSPQNVHFCFIVILIADQTWLACFWQMMEKQDWQK